MSPGIREIDTPADFYFKKMYFVFWAKRGEGYRGDVAVDDFMFREGKCQEIPAMPEIPMLPSIERAEKVSLKSLIKLKSK